MSDFTIDKAGASATDQRQLQQLILKLNPDALPKYGADGAVGGETTAALQEILGADADGSMSIEDATKALQDIVNEKALEADAGKPVSEASSENVKLIQEMIKTIDPDALPKFGADGDAGAETMAALKALSPDSPNHVIDLTNASIDQVVEVLQRQIDELPERYVVEDCDNLTEVAREVYADDIKEYTEQLMESGDPKYQNEFAARVHAEQIAVTKIALANGLEKGADAHTILPGQVLDIPDAGSLKDVDGSLDWGALDAAVGPGGPCGCDGDGGGTAGPSPKEISTTAFTPAVNPPVQQPGLPPEIQLGPNCKAVYTGKDKGFLGWQDLKDTYTLEGEDLPGAQSMLRDELEARGFDVDTIRRYQSCPPERDGGEPGDPGNPGKDGNETGGPADGPSVGL